MALIYKETKLCDIINNEPSVIPLINRFGIQLGISDHTVAEVCAARSLDVEFFLTILNTFINDGYFPEERFSAFRAAELIDYLTKTNDYYRFYQLPNIHRHFRLLLSQSDGSNNNLHLMLRFFEEVEKDLLRRIDHDSNCWFPAVLRAEDSGTDIADAVEWDDAVEDKVSDLKNMFIKHLTGDYELNLCYGVIVAIMTLEKDLRQNNRIRARILSPLTASLTHNTGNKS